MRASRLFSVPAFRFSIIDLKSAVGKWSRIATFGPKSKDGAEMMFDATTLGQMVDNAAARGDRIAIDNDHASAYPETRDAPALGFFGALAVVAGGRVVKSWNGSPDPAGLADGLYGRLDEITPRGEDPLVGLANYRTMSPMFVEEGTDEQNRPIGYALLNVAATNVPFQSGAEIMFFGVPGNSNANQSRTSAAQAMAVYDSDGGPLNVGDDVMKTSDVQAGRRIRYKVTAVADGKNQLSPGWIQIGYQGNGNYSAGPASDFIKTQHGSMSSATSTDAAASANGATTMAAECEIGDSVEGTASSALPKRSGPLKVAGKRRSSIDQQIDYELTDATGKTYPARANDILRKMSAANPANGATTMGWNANLKPGDKIRDNRTGKVGTVKAIQRDGAAEVWWDSVDHGLIMPQGEPPPDLEKLSQSNPGAARAFQGASMNPEMMQKIGLADGCSPQDKMAKFAAYAMGDASPDELKAMADDLDLAEDPAAKAMAAKLRKFVRWGEELTCPKCGSDHIGKESRGGDNYKMTCQSCGKSWEEAYYGYSKMQMDPEEEKAKVEMSRHLGGKASWKGALELFTTQRHTTIDKADLVPLKAKVAELEQKLAEREKGERESAIVSFAREAIAAGSWDPSDEAGLIEFRRSAPDAAAKNVEKNRGRWKALQTFTVGGHPVGKGPGAASTGGKSSGRGAELAAAAEEIVVKDPELLKLSRANRAEAMTMAMDRAYAKDPSLYR